MTSLVRSRTTLMSLLHSVTFDISSVRPALFTSHPQKPTSQVAHASQSFGIGCLSPSVGTCLRHLPPTLHPTSVTPTSILFTICTQKTRQQQTMYLICIRVGSTRARKIQPKNHGVTTRLQPRASLFFHQGPITLYPKTSYYPS